MSLEKYWHYQIDGTWKEVTSTSDTKQVAVLHYEISLKFLMISGDVFWKFFEWKQKELNDEASTAH